MNENHEAIPTNSIVAAYLAAIPAWRKVYRRFIARRLVAGIRKRFDICLRGVKDPGTTAIPIVAINHWTDDDPTVWLGACLAVPRLVPLLRCSVLVMGEHTFQPGFLGAYVVKEPRWLSYLLFQTNVARSVRFSGGFPVVYAHTRLLIAHLNDALKVRGNVALGDVLAGDVDAYLPGAGPDTRIRAALRFRYRDALYRQYEFSIFDETIRGEMWARHQERIRAFVDTLARLADSGRVITMAPQGLIAHDGRPQHVRSGVFQIVNAMKQNVELIPINITYDAMLPGRARAYVTIGKSLPLPRGTTKEAFRALIADAIHGDAPVTMSQLAAEALRALTLRSKSSIDVASLRDQLRARAEELMALGYCVLPDPGDATAFARRLDGVIAYFQKSGFSIENGALHFDPAIVLDERIQKNGYARRWFYCYNELQARLSRKHGDFG